MKTSPNIMNSSMQAVLHGSGMVVAGFASMVAGLCLGSYITQARADQISIHGARLHMVMELTRMGPKSIRHAGIAAMADGVVTIREERYLYSLVDEDRNRRSKGARGRAMVGVMDAGRHADHGWTVMPL